MRNASWTETEQMKVVWSIVESELLFKTKPQTIERKEVVDRIIAKLLDDPDFSARHKSENPGDTIYQHLQAWIGYLEGRRKEKPPLKTRELKNVSSTKNL
ncbi:hypothetical protein ACDX66_01015 [Peribacillus frigoritolerans]